MSDINNFLEISGFRLYKSEDDLYSESGLVVILSSCSAPVIYQSSNILQELECPTQKFGFSWGGSGTPVDLHLCYENDINKRIAIETKFTMRFINRSKLVA